MAPKSFEEITAVISKKLGTFGSSVRIISNIIVQMKDLHLQGVGETNQKKTAISFNLRNRKNFKFDMDIDELSTFHIFI